jgi:urease accessory protein
VGAALRLLPLGQLAGQRILWNVQPLIATLAAEAQNKNEPDMWSFAPALEISSMQHALLDARLFRS